MSLFAVSAAHAAWIAQGSASTPDANGYIQVTPELQNQVGAIWQDTPIDLTTDFDILMLVNLGDRDGNGADGISIVFQNDPRGTGAIGDNAAGGEWVGMHNIFPALSIEIDTYQNAARGDPACDRIGINEIIDASSLPDHSGAAPVCALASGANIEDGLDHSIRLVWDSSATLLTVYFDGAQVLTYNRNIADIFGGTSTAWFGVVGSTGGAFNDQQFKAILPGSDLVATKTAAPGVVNAGDSVTYTVVMENNSTATAFITELQDQLPVGFAHVPGSTSGLSTGDPAVAGQLLTWSGNWQVAPGGTATLGFQAAASPVPGIYFNNVTLRGTNFADMSTGNTAQVTVGSNLSTSTLGVVDLNGGDVEPGDVLQYTVSLVETAGLEATGVSLVDDLPADVSGLNLHLSLPPGAVDASNAVQVNLSDLTIPANGTVTVVFDVTVLAGTADGTTIGNTAVIGNLSGIGANPNAPTLVVTNSSATVSGAKPLYLYDNLDLSRAIVAGAQNDVRINGGQDATWTLAPATTLPLTIDGSAGTIPVSLWIRGGRNRLVTMTLSTSAGVIGTLGPLNINQNNFGSAPVTYEIPITNPGALVDISSIRFTVDNQSTRTNRRIRIHPFMNGVRSRVDLESLTLIRVESVRFHDAPYPGGSVITGAPGGGTVYIRSVVSDPFGSFDISSAAVTLTTPGGAVVVGSAPMVEVAADANGPYKTYEYAYPSPPGVWPDPLESGPWTARVTAEEGTEGLVNHTRAGVLLVGVPPDIVLVKSVQSHEDPINGAANPFSLPGASMTYTVTAANHGGSGITPDSIILIDAIPSNTFYLVNDLGSPWGPVAFIDSAPLSGLTFNPANDLTFSIDSGLNYNLTIADLVPDVTGCDPRITHVRINPKGVFNGISGTDIPEFTLQFRVRVQ